MLTLKRPVTSNMKERFDPVPLLAGSPFRANLLQGGMRWLLNCTAIAWPASS